MQSDKFAAGGDPTVSASAEVYIHAKHPDRIRSSWARSRAIAKCYNPEWNDVRIVRAMLALAEDALRDERTTHVMFVTESCIPIATLAEVASRIVVVEEDGANGAAASKLNWDRSFVDAYGRDSTRCTRFDEREYCRRSLTHILLPIFASVYIPKYALLNILNE